MKRLPVKLSVRFDEVKAKLGTSVELNVGSEKTTSGGLHSIYELPAITEQDEDCELNDKLGGVDIV